LEPELLGLGVKLHAQRNVFHGHVALAPVVHDHRIDEQGEHKVDRHAGHHDDESLPRALGAKLPRLRVALHLLGIHALVNHSRNLTIASQGQPAHAILRRTVLGLEAEELAAPLADADIEEHEELFHPDTKELGRQGMTALVEQY